MKQKILILLCLFIASALCADSIFPYKYSETALDNGLKVILIPMKNQGLVSYYTIVHTGSRDEVEAGKSGFAHFFEHMMFRGTEKYPAEKRGEVITEMGADMNAYTTDDYTCYYMHFPDRYLEQVVDMESDRFMNLKYTLPVFQTEARAVLGEYNKNFANPFFQLEEKLRETAFDRSSYKHTTMGFLKDVEDMPNQFDYSLQFFRRFYRPENCTILVTGNFDPARALELIRKHYSSWEKGSHVTKNEADPKQESERRVKVDYPGDTLPVIALGYRGPAFAPDSKEFAALSLLGDLAFGETSEVFRKLVLDEKKADFVASEMDPHRDPYLFIVYSRLKDPKDLSYAEETFTAALEAMKEKPVDPARLADLKSNRKYSFLMSLDTSSRTGATLATYLELTRSMEGIEQLFRTYDSITPEDIRNVAQKYLGSTQRTVTTLTGAKS